MKTLLIGLALLASALPAHATGNCWIGEYSSMADTAAGPSVPVWGNLLRQPLSVGTSGTSAQSALLHASTRYVRIYCTTDAPRLHMVISVAEDVPNPVASASDTPIPLEGSEGFAAAGGQKIAFIEGS
jgi:hypothetical protein